MNCIRLHYYLKNLLCVVFKKFMNLSYKKTSNWLPQSNNCETNYMNHTTKVLYSLYKKEIQYFLMSKQLGNFFKMYNTIF